MQQHIWQHTTHSRTYGSSEHIVHSSSDHTVRMGAHSTQYTLQQCWTAYSICWMRVVAVFTATATSVPPSIIAASATAASAHTRAICINSTAPSTHCSIEDSIQSMLHQTLNTATVAVCSTKRPTQYHPLTSSTWAPGQCFKWHFSPKYGKMHAHLARPLL